MREVFLLMKYNLSTLKIYFKQGRKFKFFCQIKIQENSVQILKYILNTLKSVSKYIWFGKGNFLHSFSHNKDRDDVYPENNPCKKKPGKARRTN